MTVESALGVLDRYHKKVAPLPLKGGRKRGNPPEVIKAVAFLRGGKHCTNCGSTTKPRLHHIDGIWKNYRFWNLKFYCQRCHLACHDGCWKNTPNTMENYMARVTWVKDGNITKEGATLVRLVNARKDGVAVDAECERLAGLSQALFGQKLVPSSLSGQYYKLRNLAPSIGHAAGSMELSEAIGFYRFLTAHNITVITNGK